MGFKSVEQYTEDRYHNMFRLVNDGESADVIILYRSKADMLVGDVHYVKNDTYTGYTHCMGKGCPVCAIKKPDGTPAIRVQTKTFIPIYNIEKGQIEFWDRNYNNGFLAQLDRDIFNIYPNPSEIVFKVTRRGAFNDKNTRYTFTAVGTNSVMSYDQILAKFQIQMPDYYENIVKSFSMSELTEMLQAQKPDVASNMPAYTPIPRSGYQSSIPNTFVNASEVVGTPDSAPQEETDPILGQFDDITEDIIDEETLDNIDLPDTPF